MQSSQCSQNPFLSTDKNTDNDCEDIQLLNCNLTDNASEGTKEVRDQTIISPLQYTYEQFTSTGNKLPIMQSTGHANTCFYENQCTEITTSYLCKNPSTESTDTRSCQFPSMENTL